MVNDYAGRRALFAKGVTELGCWAHARRKLFDLQAANGSPVAGEAIARIAALCRVEAHAQAMTAGARHAHRQQHAPPRLRSLKTLLDGLRCRSPATAARRGDGLHVAALGRAGAIHGARRARSATSRSEARSGRSQWAASETAGCQAVAIMSLLATAKANGHEPQACLTDVLTGLPILDRDIRS